MLFNKIITLSLNPVADITCYLNEFQIGEENRVENELYDAAGKAVDVSRVLQSYEIPNTALIVAGEENSKRYFERLKDENVTTRIIFTQGRLRENITIISANGVQTRLMRQGPRLKHKTIDELEVALSEEIRPTTLVVVAGKMPEGITSPILCEICAFIKEAGGIIALDTQSVTMEDIAKIRPWVIKPNFEELSNLVGRELDTIGKVKQAAIEIADQGVRHVLASLGGEGMVYTDGKVTYKADVPELSEIKSTVGAGDAALAGFIIAHDYKYDVPRSLQFSAAFGTASCLVEGTNPPRRISVAMVNNQVNVYEI
ncbi:1-phosphofructokinase family hexose kinase [Youxingia wuxianensis]|uniref:Tagatose-6-phosphate kinase n=1 Tax=Youxingia wuxianensis TaxID=2763678 RepID=A0A926IGJ1_9FIRM|nr:hexose kinase [Youxingia wuxianensis]MBC8584924.1 hexose kinase [Youxingia wuxianensis]